MDSTQTNPTSGSPQVSSSPTIPKGGSFILPVRKSTGRQLPVPPNMIPPSLASENKESPKESQTQIEVIKHEEIKREVEVPDVSIKKEEPPLLPPFEIETKKEENIPNELESSITKQVQPERRKRTSTKSKTPEEGEKKEEGV